PYFLAAVLSSINPQNLDGALAALFERTSEDANFAIVATKLLGLAGAMSPPDKLGRILETALQPSGNRLAPWQAETLAGVLEALERRGLSWQNLPDSAGLAFVKRILKQAQAHAVDERASIEARLGALPFLGRDRTQVDSELDILGKLLAPNQPLPLQT